MAVKAQHHLSQAVDTRCCQIHVKAISASSFEVILASYCDTETALE